MQGILYLDKEPKFPVDTPTAKANMKVKIKKNKMFASLKILRNVEPKPLLKNTISVKMKKARDSKADKKMIGFFDSQRYGR